MKPVGFEPITNVQIFHNFSLSARVDQIWNTLVKFSANDVERTG